MLMTRMRGCELITHMDPRDTCLKPSASVQLRAWMALKARGVLAAWIVEGVLRLSNRRLVQD